jgi:dipeptidyl-peptidase III
VTRRYLLERVDDAAVVQIYADGFERLPLERKRLAWHLYQAALAGRDIYYDQRHAQGLALRDFLEQLVRHGERIAPAVFAEITRYTKLFWIHSGPYNNLTARKFVLRLDETTLVAAAEAAAAAGARFALGAGENRETLVSRLAPMLLDPAVDPIVTSKTPGPGRDILEASANNLYGGVSLADLEGFEERYALNSRLVRRDGRLIEEVYRLDGRYGAWIARIVAHLEAARDVAPPATADALDALIRFYRTGEEDDRRAYDIAWVADQEAEVDAINGFVEVYLDPRGHKGAWEGIAYYVNREKTDAIAAIAGAAQWFEDQMPWDPAYRRERVQGVSARAIDVLVETGDSGPMTAIGINLPNDEAVREVHGSKSVLLSNVVEAYERSTPHEMRVEFSWSDEEVARAERWSALAAELTTNLHEVLGHGSGRVSPRLEGSPQAVLREQYSALEETRADLVALYFVADPKLVELGVVPAEHHEEIVLAEYEAYARNALLQLRRIREGTQIEEDHMRNRQAIVHWLMANTAAVERRVRDGKTYYVMADAAAFRRGVATMLAEVQRIKAEGDYEAARALFETYGVHFDAALRDEIVARVDSLHLPSYTAFVMPRLVAVRDAGGALLDVRIEYPCDLAEQMLEYSAVAARSTGTVASAGS